MSGEKEFARKLSKAQENNWGKGYETNEPNPAEKCEMSSELLRRFWKKVNKTDYCWLWTGSKTWSGYGEMYRNGKRFLAHRLSYEHFKETIPLGLVTDHLCRVRHCVNPDHMEIVTVKENTLRGLAPSAFHALKRVSKCGKPYDYIRSNGKRGCRNCERIKDRRNYYINRDKILAHKRQVYAEAL